MYLIAHQTHSLLMTGVKLYKYQEDALDMLKTGSILCGGVGSGKSRTAIAYYFLKECKGRIKINGKGAFSDMKNPKDLYIITTAKKRDILEWEEECAPFMISRKRDCSLSNVKVTVDSWNNIAKYIDIKDAFFIFDEQRLIGSGKWVKSFLKIVKKNNWILLSATPGDTWSDYIPVFIANGFYKNRTEFLRRHAVYNRFTKFPKVERYLEQKRLERFREEITVPMDYKKATIAHRKDIIVPYNKDLYKSVMKRRWNIYKEEPVKTIGELCYILRRVVNLDPSRIEQLEKILKDKSKVIVFYNFNYELEILREIGPRLGIPYSEWNGHKHEEIPKSDQWLYLVQYTAGAEGWNCIETDTIVFFSQNYSYKIMVQSAGRIDRLNSPFKDLYYYHIRSSAPIDLAISRALKRKKNFNASNFIK